MTTFSRSAICACFLFMGSTACGDGDEVSPSDDAGAVDGSLDTSPPNVVLESPIDGTVLQRPVTASGSITDDSGMSTATLLVDGTAHELQLDAVGRFSFELTGLSETNRIEVVAHDAAGNETVVGVDTLLVASGVLDTTFGDDTNPTDGVPDGYLDVGIFATTRDDDGSIYGFTTDRLRELTVHKLMPDGTADVTFGVAGQFELFADGVPLGVPERISPRGVFFTPGGKLLISATTYVANPAEGLNDLFVFQLNANGTLDTTFGQDLFPVDGTPDGFVMTPTAGVFDVRDMVFDSTNNIVIAGVTTDPQGATIWRFTPQGLLDTRFGNGGVVRLPGERAMALALDSADLFVLANSESGSFVAKLDPAGNLIPGFHEGGIQPLSSRSAVDFARLGDDAWLIAVLNQDTYAATFQFASADFSAPSPLVEAAPPGLRTFPIAVERDIAGNVIMGSFTIYDSPYQHVIRVRPDRTIDPNFGNETFPDGGGYFLSSRIQQLHRMTIDAQANIFVHGNSRLAKLR